MIAVAGRRLFAVLGAVALFLAAMVVGPLPAPSAHAQVCNGQYEGLSWQEGAGVNGGVYNSQSGFAKAGFTWSFMEPSAQGDTLNLTLPDELKAADTTPFPLFNAAGEQVAQGTWSGKTLTITVTTFADSNFDVRGDAFVSVEWDRATIDTTRGFKGGLHFSGCGSGILQGEYGPDGPAGDTHDNGKTGVYDGLQDNGTYKMRWSIGISGESGAGQPFTVTDQAPAGWAFTCDGADTDGFSPLYMSTIYPGSGGFVNHQVMDNAARLGGGTITGTSNVTETIPHGYNYELACSAGQITARFPYGVSNTSSPVLHVTAVRATAPESGSTVTKTAVIAGESVSGSVLIPGSGGSGDGRKGGFVISKAVAGVTTPELFTFDYTCTSSTGGADATGFVSLEAGASHHVGNLDKGLTCTVTEHVKVIDGLRPTTTWTVNGEAVEKVTFPTNASNEDAVRVHATNTYTQNPVPTGGFAVQKLVEGPAAALAAEQSYRFTWTCGDRSGDLIVEAGRTTAGPSDIPVGTDCLLTESAGSDVVAPKGTAWKLSIPDNGEFTITDSVQTITAVNHYEHNVGGFSIAKSVGGDAADLVVGKEFAFSWTCVAPDGHTETGATVVAAGTTAQVNGVREGSRCVVTENAADVVGATHTLTLLGDDVTVDGDEASFTIGAPDAAAIVVNATNTYLRDKGSFVVIKELAGSEAARAKDKEFTFHYLCTADGLNVEGELTVTGAGRVSGPALPAGAECLIAEDDAAISGLTWKHTITADGKLNITAGESAEVTVVNSYTKPGLPWWPLIPLIPLIPILGGSSTSSGSAVADGSSATTPVVSAPGSPAAPGTPAATITPAKPGAPTPTTPQKTTATSQPSLANTGASVLGLLALALGALTLGVLLLLRRRQA
ncbi:DUF5979 domain-containing protein [Corynebacterium nasicanis]|uniref:DUF5979 domain-containing protein n=1 Tax=Corynebacterium nasicanis TaxID=1448267 RepID=UPI00366B9719